MNKAKYIFSFGMMVMLASCTQPADSAAGNMAAGDADNWVDMSGSFDGWRQLGSANWRIENGEFVADSGNGHLVTERDYDDFQIQLEFWADEGANSGVFYRISNPDAVADSSAYEANIFDTRPDQSGRTGGIVNFAAPVVLINTPGRWNTYDITANGTSFKIKLNGVTTVVLEDDTYDSGPISLQYGSGLVKFRNVRIREL
ncbi:MAG: DUF1080 domain-containing protein [Pseudohongiellaceae bacterium]